MRYALNGVSRIFTSRVRVSQRSSIKRSAYRASFTGLGARSLFLSGSLQRNRFHDDGTTGTVTTGRAQTGVIEQLRRVAELQDRVRGTNVKAEKQGIIAKYPCLRRLLEQVCDPNFRTHLTFSVLAPHIETAVNGETQTNPSTSSSGSDNSTSTGDTVNFVAAVSGETASDAPVPDSLIDLLHRLSSRAVTCNAARELVIRFLRQLGVLKEELHARKGGNELVEIFRRLLDCNLVAGFGARTLSQIDWYNAEQESSSSSTFWSRRNIATSHSSIAPSAHGLDEEGDMQPNSDSPHVAKSQSGKKSLRFLRIKTVSDGGHRDV